MPTNISRLSNQAFDEIYAQVIGLYGDPTDDSDGSVYDEVFGGGSVAYCNATETNKKILWSRLVICELSIPYDTGSSYSELAVVLRPRALWLFKNGSEIEDYIGNSVTLANLSDGTISPPNPTYYYGDIIRVGTLPAPTIISPLTSNWQEGFTFLASEGRDPTLSISDFRVYGSSYSSRFPDFIARNAIYYDKNVDARTRFGGGGGTSATSPCPLA